MKTSFAALALAGLALTVSGCAKPEAAKPATPAAPAVEKPADAPKADTPAPAAAEAPKAP